MKGERPEEQLEHIDCSISAQSVPESGRVALLADGLVVRGNILIGQGFRAEGEVRLNGCEVRRNLDASGGSFVNPAGYALSVAGATVRANLRCYRRNAVSDDKMVCKGGLRLGGSTIEGSLDLTQAVCTSASWDSRTDHPDGTEFSIEAAGLQVKRDVRMIGLVANGCVDMTNVEIGCDLQCERAKFWMPGMHALIAEGAVVGGGAWMSEVETDGILRLVHAQFMGRLRLTKLKLWRSPQSAIEDHKRHRRRGWPIDGLTEPHRLESKLKDLGTSSLDAVCGLNMNRATVIGTFELGLLEPQSQIGYGALAPIWVSLHGCVVGEFDDIDAWGSEELVNPYPYPDRVAFEGFRYERLIRPGLFGADNAHFAARLAVLDREYAPLNRYPHPLLAWLGGRWPTKEVDLPDSLRGKHFKNSGKQVL